MPLDDAELLRRFAKNQDELAFRELVDRHLGLVYQAARRKLGGDEAMARDVAQQTFLALARKAVRLGSHHNLAGWLYRTAHYTAAQSIRRETRRRRREMIAHEMLSPESQPNWETLAPVIDDVLTELSERDREAVLLRFFEGKSFGELGHMLGLSPDAARMRVERALDKLQPLLARRGVVSTSAALSFALAASGASDAPAGLATSVVEAGLAISAGTTGSTLSILMTGKLKLLAIAAAIGGGAAVLMLKPAVRSQFAVAQEMDSASKSLTDPSEHKAGSIPASLISSATPSARAEANPKAQAATAETSIGLLSSMTPIAQLGNRGRATPREALATQLWAAHAGDVSLEAKCLLVGPKGRAEYEARIERVPESIRAQHPTAEELVAFALSGSPRPVSGAQVLEENQLDNKTVTLKTSWGHEGSTEIVTNTLYFYRTDDGWKLIVGASGIDRAIAYLSSQTVPAVNAPASAQ